MEINYKKFLKSLYLAQSQSKNSDKNQSNTNKSDLVSVPHQHKKN